MKDSDNLLPPESIFPAALTQRIRECGIFAVVVVDDAGDAEALACCLADNGISAVELTLRTPAAFESLQRIRAAQPEMLVCMGTILTAAQAQKAAAMAADLGVAPGATPGVIQAAAKAGLPFAPGVATPTEVEAAIGLGCRMLKFFPAEPCGGIAYLNSINAPYAHLQLEYIPLGGLNEKNFTDYLALDCVPAVGGSWIAPRELIRARDWETIGANARRAVDRLT